MDTQEPDNCVKCCGLALPADELVCPVCVRWLHVVAED